MAEQTPNYDFARYQHGALAARMLASKENARYAPSALEVLAGEKGLKLGEEAYGFIKGTQASDEGIRTAAEVYAGKFHEKRDTHSPADLFAWYSHLFKDLEPREREKFADFLGQYKETLESIKKDLERASHILEGEKKNIEDIYTKEQIYSAKKTLEKYGNLLVVMTALDNYHFESLRPDAVNVARKEDLKDLASKL